MSEGFDDLLPLSPRRTAPGEYDIVDAGGRVLWRMEGAALAEWVCGVLNAAQPWRPIKTAPKDGSLILATGCNGFRTVVAAWWKEASERYGTDGEAGWRGVINDQGVVRIAEPTHWMPLPPASS